MYITNLKFMNKVKKWFIANDEYEQGKRARNAILAFLTLFGFFLESCFNPRVAEASDFVCANVESETQCFDIQTKKVYHLVNNQYHLVK